MGSLGNRPAMLAPMADLPDDPFLPDPRVRDAPWGAEVYEGAQLMVAFVNNRSLSATAEALQAADRLDVERVVLFALASQVRDILETMVDRGYITAEESKRRYGKWLLGPSGDGTLDDLEEP
jgi:hypothetical protein